jgi:hypothetical protein
LSYASTRSRSGTDLEHSSRGLADGCNAVATALATVAAAANIRRVPGMLAMLCAALAFSALLATRRT